MTHYNPFGDISIWAKRIGKLCPCEHDDVRHSLKFGCMIIGCPCKDGTRSIAPEAVDERTWRLATELDKLSNTFDASLAEFQEQVKAARS